MTDAGFDADAPVTHSPEGTGAFMVTASEPARIDAYLDDEINCR
ncbi:hypothetical protein ABIA39_007277 [Nocardia sp. GAS34]